MDSSLLRTPASAHGEIAFESETATFAQEFVVVTTQEQLNLKWAAGYDPPSGTQTGSGRPNPGPDATPLA